MKRLIAIFLSFLFPISQAYAADLTTGFSLSDDIITANQGSEFISGRRKGAVLMKVNLWGAVRRPGIHHVPVRTDLVNLLSYAGGPTSEALLSDVVIKRKTGGQEKRIEVDLNDIISGSNTNYYSLEANDIIVVPEEKMWINNNTVVVVGVISTVLTMSLTAIYISNQGN